MCQSRLAERCRLGGVAATSPVLYLSFLIYFPCSITAWDIESHRTEVDLGVSLFRPRPGHLICLYRSDLDIDLMSRSDPTPSIDLIFFYRSDLFDLILQT
jgi:hypothetical protein